MREVRIVAKYGKVAKALDDAGLLSHRTVPTPSFGWLMTLLYSANGRPMHSHKPVPILFRIHE